MALSRKDHLLDTALRLFNRDGYHATGIDKILAEAGVAKMTLYNHFKSKDELILATLRLRDSRWRDWFVAAVEARAATPSGRLLAAFDTLEEWFAQADFNGCMFIRAAGEFADSEDPIHAACAEHQRKVFDYLLGLAEAAGAARPAQLARSLMLLVEGAITVTQVGGTGLGAAKQARRTAELLLAEALDREAA